MSIQLLDRNGFKETITSEERLRGYQKNNFLGPQPYTRVMRIYARNQEGKTPSRLTTYHANGEISQYLEILNGRACGIYREWHPNGKLHLDSHVIEGLGDLSEDAKEGWVFDGVSSVWDEEGILEAEFNYEKGLLEGPALYYFPSGQLKQQIPYEKGGIQGDVLTFNAEGQLIGKATFEKGKREGLTTFKGDHECPAYTEHYENDLLVDAVYHDFSGKILSRVGKGFGEKIFFKEGRLFISQEYQAGLPGGEVKTYDVKGRLESLFHLKEGMKQGLEWVYYPSSKEEEPVPKLSVNWLDDQIHGITRTYFPDGTLESERELFENQLHGVSTAWYCDGSIRLIEEYDQGELVSGSYMQKGDPLPASSVEKGDGTATLYDENGLFVKRIKYEKGQPVLE